VAAEDFKELMGLEMVEEDDGVVEERSFTARVIGSLEAIGMLVVGIISCIVIVGCVGSLSIVLNRRRRKKDLAMAVDLEADDEDEDKSRSGEDFSAEKS